MQQDRTLFLEHLAAGEEELHRYNWIAPVHMSPSTMHVPLRPTTIHSARKYLQFAVKLTTQDGE
jgi:hypothetical protein